MQVKPETEFEGINYHFFDISDIPSEDIKSLFTKTNELINNSLKNGNFILFLSSFFMFIFEFIFIDISFNFFLFYRQKCSCSLLCRTKQKFGNYHRFFNENAKNLF